VTGYATGSGGSKVKGVLYFPTDPGYRDTVSTMCLILAATADCMFMETQARMLVESGLSLAFGVGVRNNIIFTKVPIALDPWGSINKKMRAVLQSVSIESYLMRRTWPLIGITSSSPKWWAPSPVQFTRTS
jgi:hypothetical protein